MRLKKWQASIRLRSSSISGPAPHEGQPHLRRLYAILKSVAPEAEEAIKWGTPFFVEPHSSWSPILRGAPIFVEPRFLFAFSAHKSHLSFAPTSAALEACRKELEKHKTTKNTLQIPNNKALPEDLVRKIAERCVRDVRKRKDDAFW